jgi:acetylornithine deacetylase/succinyl-diaminopimelate desuccinylase-like protein
VDQSKTEEIQEYLRRHEPAHYSMLRTSLATTMIQGGYRVNIIPSQAEAVLDVRTMPGENPEAFVETMRKVVGDPSIEVIHTPRRNVAIGAPSRLDTEMYRILEETQKRIYPGAVTMPVMSTGGTDKAYLQARGMQCYGIGPATDDEDGPKGFGAHSDQERILEEELYRFVRFNWEVVLGVAGGR